MDTSYRFTSDVEPTEKQLDNLMKEVLIEVKEKAKIADIKCKEIQKQQILRAIENKKSLVK